MRTWIHFPIHLMTTSFLLGGYITNAMIAFILISDPKKRRSYLIGNISRWSRRILSALDMRVIARNQSQDGTGKLILCNHLSYIDVLAISSLSPAVFVTSMEVKNTPVLGLICRLGGTAFVERRNRSTLARDQVELADALREGKNVVVFAESTCSDGSTVLPFKAGLVESAIRVGAEVLPLCLKYRSVGTRPMNRTLADCIFYYGEMTFFPQFLKFLSLRGIQMEIGFMEPISPASGMNRWEIADRAHQSVSQAYEDAKLPATQEFETWLSQRDQAKSERVSEDFSQ